MENVWEQCYLRDDCFARDVAARGGAGPKRPARSRSIDAAVRVHVVDLSSVRLKRGLTCSKVYSCKVLTMVVTNS